MESVTVWVDEHKKQNELSDNDYAQGTKLILNKDGEVEDMPKNNSDELKKLEDEKAELEKKLDESAKANQSEKDELAKKLEEQTAKLEEALKDKQNSGGNDDEAAKKIDQLQKDLEETKVSLTDQSKKFDEEKKRFDDLQETRRQERLAHKIEGVKIPRIREYVSAFYEAATATSRVETMKFSDGDKQKDMDMETIVDQFVEEMNKMADIGLFQEKSKDTEFELDSLGENDDPRVEVDARTTKWMSENDSVDYEKALVAVFAADPKLKEAYANS